MTFPRQRQAPQPAPLKTIAPEDALRFLTQFVRREHEARVASKMWGKATIEITYEGGIAKEIKIGQDTTVRVGQPEFSYGACGKQHHTLDCDCAESPQANADGQSK